MNKIKHLIIDGTNIEFRMFCVTKKNKEYNENFEQIGCVQKFLSSFKKMLRQFNPQYVWFTWDKRLSPHSTNFRKELLKNTYKSNRVKMDDIQDMFDQEAKLLEILEAFGCRHIYPDVLEADDVIAWLSKNLDEKKLIVSVDSDILQLVNENVSVYNMKDIITTDNFENMVGVKLQYFKLYKAIMGDVSDNIIGLYGYGRIKAKQLAETWEEQKNLPIFDFKRDIVDRNLLLIDLDVGYKQEVNEEATYENQYKYLKNCVHGDFDKFRTIVIKYGLNTILKDIKEWRELYNRNSIINIIERIG